jgi:hypothetical protein
VADVDLLRRYIPNDCSIYYNNSPYQLPTSTTCGFFVAYYILSRILDFDLDYEDFLSEAFDDDLMKNEAKVVSLQRQNGVEKH